MLRDRIMDLSQFTLIAIFSVLLAGVPEATPWASKETDRRDGYDLQRGPVLYEAYYPDDQGLPNQQRVAIDPQTASRYYDRGNVLEQRTYQAVGGESEPGVARERNFRNGEETFPGDYNAASVSPERFRSSGQETRNPTNRRATSDQAYEVARQLKRFVEGLEQDPSPLNDPNRRDSEDLRSRYGGAVAGSNFRANNRRYPPTDYDAAEFPNEKFRADTRRLDDYMNIILSAVKKQAIDISKEQLRDLSSIADNAEGNVRVSRQQRFVESEDSFNRPRPPIRSFEDNFPETRSQDRSRGSDDGRYLNKNDQLNSRVTFGDEYRDARGPISQIGFPYMENIFQPRPQVISYVFSPTKKPRKEISSMDEPNKSIDRKEAYLNDQPLASFGDNFIGNESKKKVEKSDGLGIASIEVSEVPHHHKIRHHHGEKPRRNHQQRHAAAAKAGQ